MQHPRVRGGRGGAGRVPPTHPSKSGGHSPPCCPSALALAVPPPPAAHSTYCLAAGRDSLAQEYFYISVGLFGGWEEHKAFLSEGFCGTDLTGQNCPCAHGSFLLFVVLGFFNYF